jgi:hypothetical protein
MSQRFSDQDSPSTIEEIGVRHVQASIVNWIASCVARIAPLSAVTIENDPEQFNRCKAICETPLPRTASAAGEIVMLSMQL